MSNQLCVLCKIHVKSYPVEGVGTAGGEAQRKSRIYVSYVEKNHVYPLADFLRMLYHVECPGIGRTK